MKKLKLLFTFCILTFAISCGQQKKYVEYTLKKGETIKTVAKDLNLDAQDLARLNPDIAQNPKANTIIIVPNLKRVEKVNKFTENLKLDRAIDSLRNLEKIKVEKDSVITENEVISKNFLIHEVSKGDTFYSLTRFYNVTQQDLIELNPLLVDGLKLDTFIKIKPKKEDEVEVLIYKDEIEENISLKVAMLLPFKTFEFDTLSTKDIFDKSTLANIVTDFYLGADIAIDSLKTQGVSIDLKVYDTERNGTKIREILTTYDLNENDVIIGPLYSEEAEIVANKVKKPVVFPVFSKKQSKFKSPRIIKTSPSKDIFRETLVSHIKEQFTNGTVTVIGDGKSNSNFQVAKVKAALKVEDSISEVHVLKPENGYIDKERLLKNFKKLSNNWVVLATDDRVIASDAINSLISLPDSISAKVFAIDKGKAFDKISNIKLAKIGLTYVSDRFVDESSTNAKLFNKQYLAKNHSLPTFYATKGFDITYDILMRLASGDQLKTTFKNGSSYRVESKFNYTKKLFSTTDNNGVFIIKYNNDLTLERIK